MLSVLEAKRIKDLVEPVFERHAVSRAVFFGSRVRGDTRLDSDYDFLCEFDRERQHFGLFALSSLCRDLDTALRGCADVIDWDMAKVANPSLCRRAEQEGVVVYERQEQRP